MRKYVHFYYQGDTTMFSYIKNVLLRKRWIHPVSKDTHYARESSSPTERSTTMNSSGTSANSL